jgi:hypothetical protein
MWKIKINAFITNELTFFALLLVLGARYDLPRVSRIPVVLFEEVGVEEPDRACDAGEAIPGLPVMRQIILSREVEVAEGTAEVLRQVDKHLLHLDRVRLRLLWFLLFTFG